MAQHTPDTAVVSTINLGDGSITVVAHSQSVVTALPGLEVVIDPMREKLQLEEVRTAAGLRLNELLHAPA